MPIYVFEHTDTGERFEEMRLFKDIDKPFIAPDGKKCKRILFPPRKNTSGRATRAGMKLESFEADPDFVKKVNPKYVKFHDGHREKFDPTKHC